MRTISTKIPKVLEGKPDRTKWAYKKLMWHISQKSYRNFGKNTFVDVPSQTIRTWLMLSGVPSSEIEPTKKLFRDTGLWEVDESYSTAKHQCKKYKIPDAFISASFHEHFTENVVAVKNWLISSDKNASECSVHFFDRQVKPFYKIPLECLGFSQEFGSSLPFVSKNGSVDENYNDYLLNLFQGNVPRYCVYKGGRVYTSFNSIPKQLRTLCLLNGEPVVELDAKTLHPRLLAHHSGDSSLMDVCQGGDVYQEIAEFWACLNETTPRGLCCDTSTVVRGCGGRWKSSRK